MAPSLLSLPPTAAHSVLSAIRLGVEVLAFSQWTIFVHSFNLSLSLSLRRSLSTHFNVSTLCRAIWSVQFFISWMKWSERVSKIDAPNWLSWNNCLWSWLITGNIWDEARELPMNSIAAIVWKFTLIYFIIAYKLNEKIESKIDKAFRYFFVSGRRSVLVVWPQFRINKVFIVCVCAQWARSNFYSISTFQHFTSRRVCI